MCMSETVMDFFILTDYHHADRNKLRGEVRYLIGLSKGYQAPGAKLHGEKGGLGSSVRLTLCRLNLLALLQGEARIRPA